MTARILRLPIDYLPVDSYNVAIMAEIDMYQKILAVAEGLIQTQGYNAFSYRDIADQVGVKTSSIHYHFPTKADLGKAVVKHYIADLSVLLEALLLDKCKTFRQKLTLFFDTIFSATYLRDQRMCLGGMLASDVLTLPDSVQHEVRAFFNHLEDWFTRLLNQGVDDRECNLHVDVKLETTTVLASLEGALLLARLYQDETRLTEVKTTVIERLTMA